MSTSNKPNDDEANSHTTTNFGFAQSYINNIRLKIATTLTSTMEENDRQQLFSNLNIDIPKDTSQTIADEIQNDEIEQTQEVKPSIGEAVAAALAKEASKQKTLQEQERNAIFEQAEQAAMERVKNDLLVQERKLALQRWQKELEEEQKDDSVHSSNGQQQRKEEEEEEHPVLGKVVMDFGYKRLHVMSTKKLAAVPIWEKQRVYRHERAKNMAKDKLKSMELGLPGVVALHEVRTSYNYNKVLNTVSLYCNKVSWYSFFLLSLYIKPILIEC